MQPNPYAPQPPQGYAPQQYPGQYAPGAVPAPPGYGIAPPPPPGYGVPQPPAPPMQPSAPAGPAQITGLVDPRGGSGEPAPGLRHLQGRTCLFVPVSWTDKEPKYKEPGSFVESITCTVHVFDGGTLTYGDNRDTGSGPTRSVEPVVIFEGVKISDRRAVLAELRPYVGSGQGVPGKIERGTQAWLLSGLKSDDPMRQVIQRHVEQVNAGVFVNPAPRILQGAPGQPPQQQYAPQAAQHQGWPAGAVPAAVYAQQAPAQPQYPTQQQWAAAPAASLGTGWTPPPGAQVQYDMPAATAAPQPSAYTQAAVQQGVVPPPSGVPAPQQAGPSQVPPAFAAQGWTQQAWDMIPPAEQQALLAKAGAMPQG